MIYLLSTYVQICVRQAKESVLYVMVSRGTLYFQRTGTIMSDGSLENLGIKKKLGEAEHWGQFSYYQIQPGVTKF